MHDIHTIIKTLNLEPHPEGGFYKETHRSTKIVQDSIYSRDKSAYTSIYYLLSGTDFSAWHRIQSDETWYFHLGCDVLIYFIDENKLLRNVQLGVTASNFQVTIPSDTWFAAKPVNADAFCLVSCAVAPGFEFDEFEIGRREDLIREFGTSANTIQTIEALTRS
ncbi:cupin domain-containing protein [Zwartia vadi]|uniref:cupin domain-containing protein n=1 Tax=Zwartia vadi TaxID=3058168 RepID=UPI0025B4D119|nr:cupin domain-containing protein [Zwartia vadi]MDN3987554.1 cupin domain-containing protein [Zwartia vadi]